MTEYEKAVQAMKWLEKNTFTHYVDDETGRWTKDNGGSMSDYLRALKALDWLNRNTDFRFNNISGHYPHWYKKNYGGMFGFSKFSTKESIAIVTGNVLVDIAEKKGWEDE